MTQAAGGGAEEVIPQPCRRSRSAEGETFESALRRFNKKIKQNGILSEVRRREHYEKPSVRRKRKMVAAGSAGRKPADAVITRFSGSPWRAPSFCATMSSPCG